MTNNENKGKDKNNASRWLAVLQNIKYYDK